jgi:threonine synthase
MMPTGSFKDRGMTAMVTYFKARGVNHVLEDSSGNAGASLSAYAAAAGMRCRILVPETASYPKIAQIAACGADVVTIRGSRQDVADAALDMSREIFYASHNWQPFFVEGTKTLAYELWEQLGFQAPDNVVVPLGYGSNVLGCERGFSELRGEIAACRAFSACRPRTARLTTLRTERAVNRWCRPRSRPRSPKASPRRNRREWPKCCAPCVRVAAASPQ